MKKSTVYFTLVCLLIGFNSCRRPEEVEGDYLIEGSLVVYVRDSATNRLLIGKNGERYHADSVRAYREILGGEPIGETFLDSSGQYRCGFLYYYEMAGEPGDLVGVALDKTVIVYLDRTDNDTFRIQKQALGDINIFCNGRLVAAAPASSNKSYPVTIRK